MAPNSLATIIPDEQSFRDLPLEDVACYLLIHLNRLPAEGNEVSQHGKISKHSFFDSSTSRLPYPEDIRRILLEAWNWLESEGLLVRETDTVGSSFLISRRGKEVRSSADFHAIRVARLLPRRQLHERIERAVYPTFLRGEYDTAVFQAFREVEIHVRTSVNLPASQVGTDLMRTAFATKDPPGPLTDRELPRAEQEAMGHLFAGAFGVYRNSTGHREVSTQPESAAEVIMLASQLLRIMDRLRVATGHKQMP